MNSPRFKIGDKVVVTDNVTFARNMIGKVYTVTKNKDYKKSRGNAVDYEFYFIAEGNQIWICLGERNMLQDYLRLATKLEQIL